MGYGQQNFLFMSHEKVPLNITVWCLFVTARDPRIGMGERGRKRTIVAIINWDDDVPSVSAQHAIRNSMTTVNEKSNENKKDRNHKEQSHKVRSFDE